MNLCGLKIYLTWFDKSGLRIGMNRHQRKVTFKFRYVRLNFSTISECRRLPKYFHYCIEVTGHWHSHGNESAALGRFMTRGYRGPISPVVVSLSSSAIAVHKWERHLVNGDAIRSRHARGCRVGGHSDNRFKVCRHRRTGPRHVCSNSRCKYNSTSTFNPERSYRCHSIY